MKQAGIRKPPERPRWYLTEKQFINSKVTEGRKKLRMFEGLTPDKPEYKPKMLYAQVRALLSEEFFERFNPSFIKEARIEDPENTSAYKNAIDKRLRVLQKENGVVNILSEGSKPECCRSIN